MCVKPVRLGNLEARDLVTGKANVLERTLEQKLVARVRAAGGLAVKWTAPSMAGVPDRICFFPGGRIVFVELKAPGKKPTPLQQRIHRMLTDLGADVRVVDSEQGIAHLLAKKG